MARKKSVSGAPASNAGDEFHELWALREALRLLDPSTSLKGVELEGVSAENPSDSEGPHWEGVDCALYYGHPTIESAGKIEIVQLKYSVAEPQKNWTLSRICNSSARSGNNSVARRLADAFKQVKKIRGTDGIESYLAIKLVSNQPIQSELQELKKSIAEGADLNKSAEKLLKATGLSKDDLVLFAHCLHLIGGERARRSLKEEVIRKISSYTDESAKHLLAELRGEIVRLMLPERLREVIYKERVLAWFNLGDSKALFPCEAQIEHKKNPIQREIAQTLSKAVQENNLVCLHGGGGCGKTTLLTDLISHLPDGSHLILYDCYGAGRYGDSSAPRHRAREAFTQLANEVSVKSGAPWFFAIDEEQNYAAALKKRLVFAAQALQAENPDALFVIAVDAADNAIYASNSAVPPAPCFVTDFIKLQELPPNVRLIVSSRTSKKDDILFPRGTPEVECPLFSIEETTRFVRTVWADAPDRWIEQFHHLSQRIPRVQSIAIESGGKPDDALSYLRPDGKSLEDIFKQRFEQAITRSGTEGDIGNICAALSILPTPAPIEHIARASGTTDYVVQELCQDLSPNVRFHDSGVEFANEDFENFVREEGENYTTEALGRAAENLAQTRLIDKYSAIHLFSILSAAGRGSELFEYLEERDGLKALTDPIQKRQVELQRMRAILAYCGLHGKLSEAVKTILIAAEATKIGNEIEKLLAEEPDLSVEFAEENARRTILRRSDYRPAHGPILMHLAAMLALQPNKMPLAREYRRQAYAWIKQYSNTQNANQSKWNQPERDIASYGDSIFIDYGPKGALTFIRNWTNRLTRYAAGRLLLLRIVRREGPSGIQKIESAIPRPYRFLASIACARTGHIIEKPEIEKQLNDLMRLKPSRIETSFSKLGRPGGEEVFLDDILFFCDVASYAGVDKKKIVSALEEVWPRKNRTYNKISIFDYKAIDFTLRSASIYDQIRANKFEVKAIFNIPDDIENQIKDSIERDRANKLVKVIPNILGIYDAVAALIVNGASAEGIEILFSALDSFNSNSYTLDREFPGASIRQSIARRFADLRALGILSPEQTIEGIRKSFKNHDQFVALAEDSLMFLSFDPNCHDAILFAITEVAEGLENFRSIGSEKVQAFVRLARLTLPVSREDASAFYKRAVHATREIDQEAFDQIVFLSETASAVRKQREYSRKSAIQFAQFIEDASLRLRDYDGFPWPEAFQGLVELDPSIALCALGRWADVGICDLDDGLGPTILALLKNKDTSPSDSTAFLYLSHRLDSSIIRNIIDHVAQDNGEELYAVLDELARLVILKSRRVDLITTAQPIIDRISADMLDRSNIKELSELYLFLKKNLEFLERKTGQESYPKGSSSETGIKKIPLVDFSLADVDPTSPESILKTIKEARGDQSFFDSEFLANIRERTPRSDQRAHLDALANLASRGEYSRRYLDAIHYCLVDWKNSLPVKDWICEQLPEVIKKQLPNLLPYGWYDEKYHPLYYDLIEFDSERAALLLEGLQANSESFGTRRLYLLALELLRLSGQQNSEEVLEWYVLNRSNTVKVGEQDNFLNIADDESVPNDLMKSVVAFLYRFLGDVDVRLRWCSAHVVRALVRMGRSEIPRLLTDFTEASENFVFSATNAPFHCLTALVWFAMLMARLADETPSAISPLFPRLLAIATNDELPHAVLRHHLKRALEIIYEHNQTSIGIAEKLAVEKINQYIDIEPEKIASPPRHFRRSDPRPTIKFHFDSIDTIPYWYEPAMGIFSDIEPDDFFERAEHWIVNKWGGTEETSNWAKEPRQDRYSTSDFNLWTNDHGTYPIFERYSIYLEWHAMCCVVGELLPVKHSVHHDDAWYSLESWFSRWDITLPPIWLSDLRAPKPSEVRFWQPLGQRGEEWFNKISTQEYLDELIIKKTRGKYFTVSSSRSTIDRQFGDRAFSEDVQVSSALISSKTAAALVKALQVIDDPYDYGLPSGIRDDLEINERDFQLLSFVTRTSSDEGFDGRDPFCHDIKRIAAKPGLLLRDVVNFSMSLSRPITWYDENLHETTFKLETWSDTPTQYSTREQGRLNGQYCDGWRLSVPLNNLLKYLQSLNMDLIIEVMFDRTKGDRYGRSRQEETQEVVFDKLFLLRRDGTIEDAFGFVRAWPEDRR
jgi:energy-coupling factor transporter ATP-binding protein EcfA2